MPRFPRDVDQEHSARAFERLGGERRLRSKRGHGVLDAQWRTHLAAGDIPRVCLLRSQVRKAEVVVDDFLDALKR
jgi:hypothetical protein